MFGLSKWSAKIALIEELCSDGQSNDDMVRVIISSLIWCSAAMPSLSADWRGISLSLLTQMRRSGNREVGASYLHPDRLNKDDAAFGSAMRND